jgi:hypothetical protein
MRRAQRVRGNAAGNGLRYRDHDERHEQHRLEHGALNVLGPAAALARDGRDQAAQPRHEQANRRLLGGCPSVLRPTGRPAQYAQRGDDEERVQPDLAGRF